jgi:hypothetical protein
MNHFPMQPPAFYSLIGVALSGLAIALAAQPSSMAQTSAPHDEVCIQQGTQPTCTFPKSIVEQCAALPSSSVFAQCNIFALTMGIATTKQDEKGRTYASATFKYSERNNCSSGDNGTLALLGKCDTFAAYVQLLRDLQTNRCYALVNSALLGVQRKDDIFRNNPSKVVQKLEIPGVSRRITFTPATRNPLLDQASAILVRSADPQRPFINSGPAISALSVLELESALTVKPENLKPNPAKIRLTRGLGTSSDFLDFPMGRREEVALNNVLSGCK